MRAISNTKNLVSIRKTKVGSSSITSFWSAFTMQGFPSPRQFQPIAFIAPDVAASQLTLIQGVLPWLFPEPWLLLQASVSFHFPQQLKYSPTYSFLPFNSNAFCFHFHWRMLLFFLPMQLTPSPHVNIFLSYRVTSHYIIFFLWVPSIFCSYYSFEAFDCVGP